MVVPLIQTLVWWILREHLEFSLVETYSRGRIVEPSTKSSENPQPALFIDRPRYPVPATSLRRVSTLAILP